MRDATPDRSSPDPPPGSPAPQASRDLAPGTGRLVGLARTWLPLVALLVAGWMAVRAIPGAGPRDGRAPAAATLLAVGLAMTAFTVGAVLFALRSGLGYPWKIVLTAAGYNAFIVVVKFTLAPSGLYEVNELKPLSFEIGTQGGAFLAAGGVFALYLLVYLALYGVVRRRVRRRLSIPTRHRLRRPALAVLAAFGFLALVTGGGALAVLVVPLLFALSGLEYVSFVLTSGVSLLIALGVAGAIGLAALTFRNAEEQAVLLRDAGVLTTLFWVGLALLAVYHVLWVVYILVLATLWPLKVVVPK